MKNVLFNRQASAGSSSEAPLWLAGSGKDQQGWFLREGDFARVLGLEIKRVERSHKLLLLMLLDARKVLEEKESKKVLSGILSALSSSTRETDRTGWYKEGSIIGILFTEIGEGEKSLIGKAVLARITQHLQNKLDAARAQGIVVSLHFFPEDWASGEPGSNGNQERHRDFFSKGDPRKAARVLKRVIDITGSSLALVTLSPLLGLIALLIKLTSKGPVIFRQKRVGQQGQLFDFFKFRSMHVVNDPRIHQEYVRKLISGVGSLNSQPARAGTVYKLRNDPRITPVGRFLRKTSLDELPQFWNVLRGEMSLVGPRPPIPYEVECYDIWHRRRVLDVKPGITGLWQVLGRSRTTFDEMVRLDLRYAKSWSIWLDVKILLKTPKAVLSGEGAF